MASASGKAKTDAELPTGRTFYGMIRTLRGYVPLPGRAPGDGMSGPAFSRSEWDAPLLVRTPAELAPILGSLVRRSFSKCTQDKPQPVRHVLDAAARAEQKGEGGVVRAASKRPRTRSAARAAAERDDESSDDNVAHDESPLRYPLLISFDSYAHASHTAFLAHTANEAHTDVTIERHAAARQCSTPVDTGRYTVFELGVPGGVLEGGLRELRLHRYPRAGRGHGDEDESTQPPLVLQLLDP
ncbi:hypothetical protein T492DRAFT_929439 [Pavlovales sp. CCMP2436]|nr:hypothetical protein T492DRAFT_929439 [Pavlovales sp. CCMP2436]